MTQFSTTAWVLHDLGLAAGFGGTLFGKMALNPAVKSIADERERGRVVHQAWHNYRVVDAVALATMAGSWLIGRTMLSRRGIARSVRPLARTKDALVAGAIVTGLASWLAGNALGKERDEAEGAVPLIVGGRPPTQRRARARKLLRVVNLLGTAHLVLGAAAIGVTAVLGMKSGRSSPLARLSRILP